MRTWKLCAISALTLVCCGFIVSSASAATTSPFWTCRASAAYIHAQDLNDLHVEPIAANGAAQYCNKDEAGFPQLFLPPDGGVPSIELQGPFARTDITPELGDSRDQTATAQGGVLGAPESGEAEEIPGVRVNLGELDIKVIAAAASASATCDPQTNQPVLTGNSQVVGVFINGTEIPIDDDVLTPLEEQLLENLNDLVEIHFNRQINETLADGGKQLTQRAVDIMVKVPTPVHVVVGEAIVDTHGDVCGPPQPPVCPEGSTPDPQRPGVCIITNTECPQGSTKNDQGQCIVTETQCPPNSTQNDQGQCIRTDAQCPEGSTQNQQGQCIVNHTECPEGSTENDQGQCVVNNENVQCPEGSTKNQQGQCVVNNDNVQCPEGSTKNQQGQCVVNNDNVQCPEGSRKNEQGQCVGFQTQCPEGSSPNANGQCVTNTTTCPSGTQQSANGQCVETDRTCPAGTVRNEQGQCAVTETTCPAGSTKDANGNCVAAQAEIPLQQILGVRDTSPCKNKRFGRQVGIVGSARADRITGSNRSDRIFSFAGNDRVSGGRGNDCIEAGLGFDRIDGSNGTDYLLGGGGQDIMNGGPNGDRLYGQAGNDKLIGASGNDRLYGGPGRNKLSGGLGNDALIGGRSRDYINTGGGRDTVRGGAGNDSINAATAGAAARVIDCGPGVDTARVNTNEVGRVRNCENVFTTRKVR